MREPQLNKDDLEALGLVRLDISPSAAMATVGIEAESDESTQAAAWRLLEAGDSLGISQVESVGFRMLLRRAHDLAELQSQHGQALRLVEDLAQLLALWKPGVYSKEREEAYFDARFAARERLSYPHPAMASVLDKTFGPLLYAVIWTVVGQPGRELTLLYRRTANASEKTHRSSTLRSRTGTGRRSAHSTAPMAPTARSSPLKSASCSAAHSIA
jgi:hypothetical protein